MSYRHPRYHSSGPELTPGQATAVFSGLLGVTAAALIIAGTAKSATIPRNGPFCPVSYYRIGEYCAPSTHRTLPAVRIVDETCPIGTYTDTEYCIQLERAR